MNDVDVIVVGAGAAGTTAAVAAAEGGAVVLLIEASGTWRQESNTAMSTSMIPAAGTRWQRDAGVDDSPGRFLDDVIRKTRGSADDVVARTLTDVSSTVVEWLVDVMGVPLDLVVDFTYPGHSALRCHSVTDRSGVTLLGHFMDAVDARDGIDLMVPARLTSVTVEHHDDGGDSVVVHVERPDGGTEVVRASSVVLATNGYGANPERIAEHIPEMADSLYFGGPNSVGTALDVGTSLGADIVQLDAYQGHGTVAHPHAILLTWATMVHGGIMVNSEGRRFSDESAGYSEFAREVIAQPDAVAWAVFDDRIREACMPFADFQQCVAAGAVRRADDAEELAAIIGAPVEAVVETIQETTASALAGAVDELGRSWSEPPLTGSFWAVRVTGALFHTQGGLKVDSSARVVRAGEPIPGVYAAGGAAVGMSGSGAAGYLAGNGLLAAVGLGYLAGSDAARRCKGSQG